MVIRFLPGQPNTGHHTVYSTVWENLRILLYCSGNNLIILQDSTTLLQTIYMESDCNAVSMESDKGLIAVAYDTNILIYEPTIYLDGRPPKWNYFTCLKGDAEDGKIFSLDWGQSYRELISGSKRLCFWSVDLENNKDHSLSWSKRLANPAASLVFSPDSYLMASVYSEGDQLVKIWRRSSFDIENLTFDFTYLPHSTPVRRIWWKKSIFKDQAIRNTLYTLADDGILRIWAAIDGPDTGNLQLWGSIDCQSAANLVMMFDNSIISRTLDLMATRPVNDSIENADICLIITKQQQVIIYSIKNNGILHQEKLLKIEKMAFFKSVHYIGEFRPSDSTNDVIPFILDPIQSSPKGELLAFIHDIHSTSINDISISLIDILTPKTQSITLCLHNVLTGHSKSVQNIIRSSDGLALFSQSRFSENFVWTPKRLIDGGITLSRTSYIETQGSTVIKAVLGSRGYFVLTFLDNGILKLYDCRQSIAIEAASIEVIGSSTNPLCTLLLPESDSESHIHLIAVYDWQNIQVWSVELDMSSGAGTNLIYLGNFPLPCTDDELHLAVPVDPVGWKFTVGNELDTFAREVLTTVNKEGIIRNWTSAIVEKHRLEWLEKSSMDTERYNITKISISSNDKAAIADESATELTIWDTRHGILEFQQQGTSQETIADLDWTTTTDDECVLGVGYRQIVVLYCQQRFDYTNDTPSWAAFRKVDISRYTTHSIGDSIWLSNGAFAVGAGNQVFIQDEKIDINDSLTAQFLGSRNTQMVVGNTDSIFDICSIMNGPLPLYHPQLLIQLIFAGKLDLVKSLLSILLSRIKFAPVLEPSMVFELDSNLGLDDGCTDRIFEGPDPDTSFDGDTAADLVQRLQKYSLPYLTRHQQITLVSVIESVEQIMNDIRSLDENAIKYLLGFNLYQLHRGLRVTMTTRDFNWALHSESDNVLLDIVTRVSPKPLLWPTVRDVGIPYWLKTDQLREQFEILAKNYFNADGKRDPVRCSLYYLALKKKQVLVGLWKIAGWNKEQPKTIKLLMNDFNIPRWRSAALKNAYALMGKHRFEYAAAFFLLGDSLKDAVNVILRNLDDLALAIAVARVYENGNEGPVLRYIIETHVLGQDRNKRDIWLISWGLWILNRREEATEVLIADWKTGSGGSRSSTPGTSTRSSTPGVISGPSTPGLNTRSSTPGISTGALTSDMRVLTSGLNTRSSTPGIGTRSSTPGPNVQSSTPNPTARSSTPSSTATNESSRPYLSDDPVLAQLYKYLRPKVSSERDSIDLSGLEMRFLLKVTAIYTRMGCGLLVLDLLKNWRFGMVKKGVIGMMKEELKGMMNEESKENEEIVEESKNLPGLKNAPGSTNPPKSIFEEPDMSSFEFGF